MRSVNIRLIKNTQDEGDKIMYEIMSADEAIRLIRDGDCICVNSFVGIENPTKEYLAYLDGQHISWIACGKERINLVRACEILVSEFGVERMGIVGGPAVNTGFLDAGLLDEISILMGAGIDARQEMPSVFDGFAMDHPLVHLKLTDVQKFDSDAIWIRYNV